MGAGFQIRAQASEEAQSIQSAIVLTVAFNLFTLVVFTVSGYFRGPEPYAEALRIGVPMLAVDGLIGFQLYFVLRWSAAWPILARWGVIGLAVIAVALTQAVWDTQLRIWAETMAMPYRQQFIRSTTLNTYNTGMLAALLAFQAAFAQLQQQQRLLDLARQREREAQMLALRFQLNPHFLFNTLNAISSLVVTGRTRDAEAVIDRLSSFLRGSLNADPERMVAVEDEFEMLDNYLEIESVRFGDRLAAAIDLPGSLSDAQMPPFLLQPLVENAVKYGVAPSLGRVRLTISARATAERLELEVSDSGAGGATTAGPGTGVGLANVRERLRLAYGTEGEMRVSHNPEGFSVVLSMPLVRRPASTARPLTIAA